MGKRAIRLVRIGLLILSFKLLYVHVVLLWLITSWDD